MKKLLSLMMVLFILITPAIAEGLDLEGMDYDSLMQLKQAVDAELYSRPEAEPRVLYPGLYTVGKEIPSGIYYTMAAELGEYDSAWIGVYSDQNEYDTSCDASFATYLNLGSTPKSVTLENGNILWVKSLPISLSLTEFTEEDYPQYVPPEGTLVPSGIYTIGDAIPEGIYRLFPYTITGSVVSVFDNEETYKSASGMKEKVILDVIEPMLGNGVVLEEGNVIDVYRDIVMKKQSKLEFD